MNGAKLHDALRHWQTWEAEYAGLIEELEAISPEPDTIRMLEIARQYESSVISEAEMSSILGAALPSKRSRRQVLNILKDRVHLANRNSIALLRQLQRVDETTSAETDRSDVGAEDLMEVTEHLAADDTILSSTVEAYDEAIEGLRTLKVDSTVEPKHQSANHALSARYQLDKSAASGGMSMVENALAEASVSHNSRAVTCDIINPSNSIPQLDTKGSYLTETRGPAQDVRQSLQELAPIVASLDLEEELSDEMWSEDEASSAENEYGMHNFSDELDEAYVREMEALARKHGMRNVGPQISAQAEQGGAASTGTLASKTFRHDSTTSTKHTSLDSSAYQKRSKGVRFADDLEISPSTQSTGVPQVPAYPSASNVVQMAALVDVIVEKPFVETDSSRKEGAPKASRFMMSRSGKSTGRPETTSSSSNVQSVRASVSDEDNRAQEPSGHARPPDDLSFKDELDLYRARVQEHSVDFNAFKDAEATEVSTEARISRFKAARLGM